jgi:hypothetical protein
MWIYCSKCLGPFRHVTDFWRIGKCYVPYEFVRIANISKTRMDEWNTKSLITFERWSEIFEFVRSECISLKNTQLILEFSFAIPGTSAARESIFCHKCSVDWRKEPFTCWNHQSSDSNKNTFEEPTCNGFYTLISNSPKLLQQIRSPTKYKTSAPEERTAPSTLTEN